MAESTATCGGRLRVGTDGTLAFDIAVRSAWQRDFGGGLAEQGIGVLTLTGHNSYRGTTTISQGTIAASNLARRRQPG